LPEEEYILLIINLLLILFLLIVKIMINNNYFKNDDIFFGSTFGSFQMDCAANFKYIIPVFIVSAVLSLVFKCNNWLRIIIICLSIFGALFYRYSYSAISPW